MSLSRSYVAICFGVLAAVVVALILLVSFADLGLSTHGVIALFIGALLTVALAMVLMGLVFMSDRGGRDENVYVLGARKDPDLATPPSSGKPANSPERR